MTTHVVCNNKKELNTFIRVISESLKSQEIPHKLNPLKEFIAKQCNYNTFAAMLADLPLTTQLNSICESILEPLCSTLTSNNKDLTLPSVYANFMHLRHALHQIESINPNHYNNSNDFALSTNNCEPEWGHSLDTCIALANEHMRSNTGNTVSIFEQNQHGSSRITKFRNTTLTLKQNRQHILCYS